MHKDQDFIAYLSEASKTVEQWPAWKKNGSDATSQQSKTRNNNHKQTGQAVLAQTRSR